MKCEFCNWEERPESIPALTRHLNGNHWGLENYEIVWRDGELYLADGIKKNDIEIKFDRPKFIAAPEPEVVKYATAADINAGIAVESFVTAPTFSQSPDRGTPLSPGDDVTPLIGQ